MTMMIYCHLEHTFIPQLAHVHLKKQDHQACTSANISKTQACISANIPVQINKTIIIIIIILVVMIKPGVQTWQRP